MLAAISAARLNNEAIILEKNNSLGKKLLITGKGRCNITSSLPINEFINNIPGNGKFLYSAFQNFDNKDIIELLEKHNVKTKEERGNRVFPTTDKSIDVLNALKEELSKLKVKVLLDSKVTNIITKNNKVVGLEFIKGNQKNSINADRIILATGGKSYPLTGSTGDGYKLAKNLGHTITELRPSLVPLTTLDEDLELCKSMQGLSLKNVGIKIYDIQKSKKIYEDFGEMLFTHFGVSGPTILSSSAHLVRYKDIDQLFKNKKIELRIDLKPALLEEKLDDRILRDFNKNINKELKNSLDDLLPQKMIIPIIELCKLNKEKEVNEITKEERIKLVKTLKNLTICITGFRPIEEAIITAGGIRTKEINPKTMESKIIEGLFFAGEIIDVDAYTGGFNLQIAYSSGYTAGLTEIIDN